MNGRSRIAWNLRRIRTGRGITQEALAVDADVDRTYISGIEGETFNPTIDVLDKLAAALSIDVAELLALPRKGEKRPEALPAGRKPKS